jgi:hypothetical protein
MMDIASADQNLRWEHRVGSTPTPSYPNQSIRFRVFDHEFDVQLNHPTSELFRITFAELGRTWITDERNGTCLKSVIMDRINFTTKFS